MNFFLRVCVYFKHSADCGTDRERRFTVQDVEDYGFRIGSRGLQDDPHVGSRHLRLDGAGGDQIVDLLQGVRRLELRHRSVGDPDGRDALQGHRRAGRRLRRGRQKVDSSHTNHLPDAVEEPHAKYMNATSLPFFSSASSSSSLSSIDSNINERMMSAINHFKPHHSSLFLLFSFLQ